MSEHGTHSRYSQGCRCEECRDAERTWQRAYRDKNAGRISEQRRARWAEMHPPKPPPPLHGTNSRYSQGCRCEECRSAAREYARAYRSANRVQLNAKQAERRKANPEQTKAARKRQRARNPWRGHHINATYYFTLLSTQGHRCFDCQRPTTAFRRMLDVDHDHDCCPGTFSCGECIRGLLCRSCNIKRSYAEGRRGRLAS